MVTVALGTEALQVGSGGAPVEAGRTRAPLTCCAADTAVLRAVDCQPAPLGRAGAGSARSESLMGLACALNSFLGFAARTLTTLSLGSAGLVRFSSAGRVGRG